MMQLWKQWVEKPQSLWIRKAFFQVHLWLGLALGLYVVMLSITGSAIVYGPQLSQLLATPVPAFDPSREVLTTEQLTEAVEGYYPGYTVTRIGDRVSERRPAISVSLEKGDDVKDRLLDPYTGEDLGDDFPIGPRTILWLTSLHDDLLFVSRTGRFLNGVGSILLTVLAVSGAIIWWPGKKRWRRSLSVNWKASVAGITWDLHSMLGIWLLGLTLIWCISGIYLAFPDPFLRATEFLWPPDDSLVPSPGDTALAWLVRLHFGRFRSMRWLGVVWVVLGLVPAVMFVTGGLMWWNRLFRKG